MIEGLGDLFLMQDFYEGVNADLKVNVVAEEVMTEGLRPPNDSLSRTSYNRKYPCQNETFDSVNQIINL